MRVDGGPGMDAIRPHDLARAWSEKHLASWCLLPTTVIPTNIQLEREEEWGQNREPISFLNVKA